ncbi:hypothetical protein IFR05_000487 [Cadophora sp. M221]|nr:hypothetical protein IFR05_000487 [Cadophora sp. M221]
MPEKDWEYTGNGGKWDACKKGGAQGIKEFFRNPITETAKAAEAFNNAGDVSDAYKNSSYGGGGGGSGSGSGSGGNNGSNRNNGASNWSKK